MVISYSQYRKDAVNTPVGVGISKSKISKNFKGQNKRLNFNCTGYRGLSFGVKYQILGLGFVYFSSHGEILGKTQLGLNLWRYASSFSIETLEHWISL